MISGNRSFCTKNYACNKMQKMMAEVDVSVIYVRHDILFQFKQIQNKTKLCANAQLEQFFELFKCASTCLSSNASNTSLAYVLKNIVADSFDPIQKSATDEEHGTFPCLNTVPDNHGVTHPSFNEDKCDHELSSSQTKSNGQDLSSDHINNGLEVDIDCDNTEYQNYVELPDKLSQSSVPERKPRDLAMIKKTCLKPLVSKRQRRVLLVKTDAIKINKYRSRNTSVKRSSVTPVSKLKAIVKDRSDDSKRLNQDEDCSMTEASVQEMDKESDGDDEDDEKLFHGSKDGDVDSGKTPLYAVRHYKCLLCIKTFNSKTRLSMHMAGQHSEVEKPCDKSDKMECKQSSSTVESRYKLHRHHNKYHHRQKHSEDTNKKFECNICSKIFKSQAWYTTHMRKLHSSDAKPTKPKGFSCQECPRTFKSHSGLWLHVDKCHSGKSFVCTICSKALSDAPTLKKHMICHADVKQFTCNECGRQFSLKAYLRDHMRTHTGEKPYKCDVCGREFAQTGYLTIHKRLHSGEKPYTCDVCGKQCSQAQHLKLHKRSHTGEKPYRCDLCDKSFTQVSNLHTHRRSHTGEKPFNCTACGKQFAQSSQLHTHLRTHTGEKPYKCDHCGKQFTQNVKLRAHVQRHVGVKDHLCFVCGKSFFSIHDMQKHKRTHMADKPHKCDVCGKGFIEAGYLRAHVRVHTGEKPYICDVCGKGFRLMAKLNKHKRTHREADVSQPVALQPCYSSSMVVDMPAASIPFPTPFPYMMSTWERDLYPQGQPQL